MATGGAAQETVTTGGHAWKRFDPPSRPALDDGTGAGEAPREPGTILGLTCSEAAGIWLRHQADRAWIEWGLCWPPLSVARPRCQECRTPWPCPEALSAHEHICRCGRHHAVFAPAPAREA